MVNIVKHLNKLPTENMDFSTLEIFKNW